MGDLLVSIQDCATEVFRELGSGHSENVYETALELEMRLRGVAGPIMRQVPCPIRYKGYTVGVGYIDLLVENLVVVELKAVAKLTGRDETQVSKYLAGTDLEIGLLMNFNQVSGDVEVVEVSRISEAEDLIGIGRLLIPEEIQFPDPEHLDYEGDAGLVGTIDEALQHASVTSDEGREFHVQTDTPKD